MSTIDRERTGPNGFIGNSGGSLAPGGGGSVIRSLCKCKQRYKTASTSVHFLPRSPDIQAPPSSYGYEISRKQGPTNFSLNTSVIPLLPETGKRLKVRDAAIFRPHLIQTQLAKFFSYILARVFRFLLKKYSFQ